MALHSQVSDTESGLPKPLEQTLESASDIDVVGLFGTAVAKAGQLFDLMWRPWNAYQIAIILAVFAAAYVLHAIFAPRVRSWMASREGWPTWRMRVLVVIHQRLRAIFFVALIWAVVIAMREVTWPSRSHLLAIAANLATAWLFVTLATRLIRSLWLRKVVRYGAWTYVTLSILGLIGATERILDSAAFQIGEFRLSALLLIQGVVIIGACFALARLISTTTTQQIERNKDISPSMQVLIVKVIQVAFYGLAFFFGVKAIGIDLTGLAVLSGAIGVGLGFGLQKVVSNLVSGVIILLDKSIKPGDVISLGDTFGWISTLGARYASVVTRDGKEYLIPNEDLITSQVVNWSHSNEFVRLDIFFGTAYHDDPHKVRKLAIEAAQGVDRVLSFKAPVCHIVGFGDSSVDYILRFWIKDPTGGLTNIRGNVYLALWDKFKEHDISIPFPQREVRMLENDSA